MDRRAFLRGVGAAAVGSGLLHQFWHHLVQADPVVGDGPYGALRPPNADRMQLPDGFTSKIIAVTGQPVGASSTAWHAAPDGGACFDRPGGGWVYVSNSEVKEKGGGATAVVFSADGQIEGCHRVLTGTTRNCAGGPTPWGTWLSCEELASGRVWECDPHAPGQGVVRPRLGVFAHEAAAVDPATSIVYLTEDNPSGRLYRFVPTTPGDLSAGQLEAASVSGTTVTWRETSADQPDRHQATTAFDGGEGAWISSGSLFFTTKGDNRVRELELATQTLTVLYDFSAVPGAALRGVDNITAHEQSGDLFVAEDGGNLELCVLANHGAQRVVAPFARLVGHDTSEVTGPAFSPDGSRLYFSSQRGVNGNGIGVTYEVTGPFRGTVTPQPPVVVQDPSPVAVFDATPTDLSVAFDGSASHVDDAEIVQWHWDFGDGTSDHGATVLHEYAGNGHYRVVLTVTDGNGAQATSEVQVSVTHPNAPTAAFTVSGSALSYEFDGSASTDGEGSIQDWTFDFGDGITASGAFQKHVYDSAGPRTVTLTVTDDAALLARVSQVVVATLPTTVSFVGAASQIARVKIPAVTIPADVQADDVLLFVLTVNRSATVSTPAGWTLLGTVADPEPVTRSWLFSRVATAGLAGTVVSATLSVRGKLSATVLAYRGASPALVVAGIEDAANSIAHRSPALPKLPAGSWVVGYWADESSGNTGWTVPDGHRSRSSRVGSGVDQITSLAADTGPLNPGKWPGAVASSTVASRRSVSWSVGLRPA